MACGLVGLAGPAFGGVDEHFKLLASDGAADGELGSAVAVANDLAVVGAPGDDASGFDSGAAYLFSVSSGAQVSKLFPTSPTVGARFGTSVSASNGLVVVGAPFAIEAGIATGAAFVFDATTGTQLFKLLPSDGAAGDEFGSAVAIDGFTIAIGAKRDDDLGADSGSVYLFDALSGAQNAKLHASDGGLNHNFGEALDLDGGVLVAGAHWANGQSLFSGAAYLFDVGSSAQLAKLAALDGTAFDFFGSSVAIDDGVVVVGARSAAPHGKESGSAYLFDVATGTQTFKLDSSGAGIFEHFGQSVAIDGGIAAVGSAEDNVGGFASGSVALFEVATGSELAQLVATDAEPLDELGTSVAIENGVVVAGTPHDDDLGTSAGAAYTFDQAGAVTPMAGCIGNAGTLAHSAGLAVAGHTLSLQMDSAQASGAAALLFVSSAPVPGWPACGINMGGMGELMVDIVSPNPLASFSTVWGGAPAPVAVPIPAISGLVDLHFYLQGAFLAPTLLAEPVRLTNGLEVVVGGFL